MTITVSNFGSLDNNEQKTMLNLPVNPTPNEQKKTIELRVPWGGFFVGVITSLGRWWALPGERSSSNLEKNCTPVACKTPTTEVKRPWKQTCLSGFSILSMFGFDGGLRLGESFLRVNSLTNYCCFVDWPQTPSKFCRWTFQPKWSTIWSTVRDPTSSTGGTVKEGCFLLVF